jgi:hypothetical protein
MRWPFLVLAGGLALFTGVALAVGMETFGEADEDKPEVADLTSTASPEPTPTTTQDPESTPEATAEPTTEPTTVPTEAPEEEQPEESVATPQLASAVEISDSTRQAVRRVVEGYRGPDGDRYTFHGVAGNTDNDGNTVLAAVGISRGSADGTGQRIFYFVEGDYRGTDWERPVLSVASIRPLDNGLIEVVYNVYAAGDPGCCPSGGTFTWHAGFDGTASNPQQPPEGVFSR